MVSKDTDDYKLNSELIENNCSPLLNPKTDIYKFRKLLKSWMVEHRIVCASDTLDIYLEEGFDKVIGDILSYAKFSFTRNGDFIRVGVYE